LGPPLDGLSVLQGEWLLSPYPSSRDWKISEFAALIKINISALQWAYSVDWF